MLSLSTTLPNAGLCCAQATKPDKETPIERLTAPTAMRMLKTLQQTQVRWLTQLGPTMQSWQLDGCQAAPCLVQLILTTWHQQPA